MGGGLVSNGGMVDDGCYIVNEWKMVDGGCIYGVLVG